jgi:RNA polymerase sigma-70 factor (ECF subfamily)
LADASAEILLACRDGRLAAFEQLYALHGARMKSIACNLTGNVADAEDAVQDAFVKIYRGIASFKEESALGTWIYRIVVNACYDLLRRRRRRLETAEADASEPAMDPVLACDHPLRLTLERSLERLDPQLRDVFILYEIEGFKHREVAAILGIPEGTSKYRLFEAKRALQRSISGGSVPEGRE